MFCHCHDTHNVAALYREYVNLVKNNSVKLSALARSDWTQTPVGIEALIASIDKYDSGSFFSRYPDLNDKTGNDLRSTSVELTGSEISAILGKSMHDQFVEDGKKVFSIVSDPLPELSNALEEACNILYGIHLGLRYEFFQGE